MLCVQVYIYGGLDRTPTTFSRNFGMQWSIGGWLLTPFMQKIGPQRVQALRARVAREIKTTFKTSYAEELSLEEALQLTHIQRYGKMGTGAKFCINPSKGAARL